MNDESTTEAMQTNTASRVTLSPAPPQHRITPEQCLATGGHCHRSTGISRLCNPPQYEEICKHCGHTRWAIPREPFEYREDSDLNEETT